jgi:hypothetical protein
MVIKGKELSAATMRWPSGNRGIPEYKHVIKDAMPKLKATGTRITISAMKLPSKIHAPMVILFGSCLLKEQLVQLFERENDNQGRTDWQ